MAAGLSATKANEFLNNLGNAGSVTSVTAIYAKLHLGDPGAAGASNPAAETDRVAISFGAASAGSMANDAAVTWTNVSNTETVSHVSFWDHATAGVFLGSDALATSRDLVAGDDAEFAIGALTLSITPLAA